jgi:hypothetical protein
MISGVKINFCRRLEKTTDGCILLLVARFLFFLYDCFLLLVVQSACMVA